MQTNITLPISKEDKSPSILPPHLRKEKLIAFIDSVSEAKTYKEELSIMKSTFLNPAIKEAFFLAEFYKENDKKFSLLTYAVCIWFPRAVKKLLEYLPEDPHKKISVITKKIDGKNAEELLVEQIEELEKKVKALNKKDLNNAKHKKINKEIIDMNEILETLDNLIFSAKNQIKKEDSSSIMKNVSSFDSPTSSILLSGVLGSSPSGASSSSSSSASSSSSDSASSSSSSSASSSSSGSASSSSSSSASSGSSSSGSTESCQDLDDDILVEKSDLKESFTHGKNNKKRKQSDSDLNEEQKNRDKRLKTSQSSIEEHCPRFKELIDLFNTENISNLDQENLSKIDEKVKESILMKHIKNYKDICALLENSGADDKDSKFITTPILTRNGITFDEKFLHNYYTLTRTIKPINGEFVYGERVFLPGYTTRKLIRVFGFALSKNQLTIAYRANAFNKKCKKYQLKPQEYNQIIDRKNSSEIEKIDIINKKFYDKINSINDGNPLSANQHLEIFQGLFVFYQQVEQIVRDKHGKVMIDPVFDMIGNLYDRSSFPDVLNEDIKALAPTCQITRTLLFLLGYEPTPYSPPIEIPDVIIKKALFMEIKSLFNKKYPEQNFFEKLSIYYFNVIMKDIKRNIKDISMINAIFFLFNKYNLLPELKELLGVIKKPLILPPVPAQALSIIAAQPASVASLSVEAKNSVDPSSQQPLPVSEKLPLISLEKKAQDSPPLLNSTVESSLAVALLKQASNLLTTTTPPSVSPIPSQQTVTPSRMGFSSLFHPVKQTRDQKNEIDDKQKTKTIYQEIDEGFADEVDDKQKTKNRLY